MKTEKTTYGMATLLGTRQGKTSSQLASMPTKRGATDGVVFGPTALHTSTEDER